MAAISKLRIGSAEVSLENMNSLAERINELEEIVLELQEQLTALTPQQEEIE